MEKVSLKQDSVSMVENVLKKADLTISRDDLLSRLPKQLTKQALDIILNYLEEKGFVMFVEKGILWVHNDGLKMKKLLKDSVEK